MFGFWHDPRELKDSWNPDQLDLTLQEQTEHLSSLRVHTCPFRLKPPSWGQSPVQDGPDGQRQSNPPARFTQAESFQQVWVFKAHSSISAKQQIYNALDILFHRANFISLLSNYCSSALLVGRGCLLSDIFRIYLLDIKHWFFFLRLFFSVCFVSTKNS